MWEKMKKPTEENQLIGEKPPHRIETRGETDRKPHNNQLAEGKLNEKTSKNKQGNRPEKPCNCNRS